jgi:hypothetical protein
MKHQSSKCLGRHKLSRLAGACFGFFTLQRPKVGRPTSGKGRTTVIAGSQGIYFVPVIRL